MHAEKHFTHLKPHMRLIQVFMYPLWMLCEICSLLLRPAKLSSRASTQRCYEALFDSLCSKTGIWSDYTEGYYPTGTETYDEAQIKQLDFILDQCGSNKGMQILDIGCGNGNLLKRALNRGCSASGITISRSQVEACRNQGLEVTLCSYEEIKKHFKPKQFDAIVLNGSMEHFATAHDVLNGNIDGIFRRVFELVHHVLKPGGKVFITCIHFKMDTDIRKAIKHPIRHKFGSYYFYIALLLRFHSGWYPHHGGLEKIAGEQGFKLTFERDATHDYLLTSKEWGRRVKKFIRGNISFMRSFLYSLFVADPKYFFIAILYWLYGTWGWQFTGGENCPMKHRWLMFKLEKES